jgi:pimeloyl-ACP methyl ester carboxylesterase
MLGFTVTSLALYAFFPTTIAQSDIVLPQGTGPFHTSFINEEWVDPSRPDPFNSSHLRRIMISRFDPVLPSDCRLKKAPYMTPVTAAVEDDILSEYDYPRGLWKRFVLEVCDEKLLPAKHKGKRPWPLALFSPGLNTTRLFSNHLVQEISSHGFTVISMDHPYDTDVVEFPNGDVAIGGRVQKPANGSTASVEHALEVRAQDASFVLDRLGIGAEVDDRVVMFGHSFGGAAAATALRNDQRFRGGLNLDGIMFGPVLNSSLGTPSRPQTFMLWGSDGHSSSTDPSWTQFWTSLNGSAYIDYKKEFTITNSSHGSYWDLNVLVDLVGIRDELSETAKLLIGPIPGARVWEIMGRYVPAFFWYVLGSMEEDEVLKGKSEEFPEVLMLGE